MKTAVRLTLDYPVTFKTIGESLCLFDGWVLHELALFRKRRRDSVVACLVPRVIPRCPNPGTV